MRARASHPAAGAGLPPAQLAAAQPLLAATSEHLAAMAGQGYRTLVVAARQLEPSAYAAWAERYRDACASMTDRAGRVAAVCDELERELDLLGATAVEDKLQVALQQRQRSWCSWCSCASMCACTRCTHTRLPCCRPAV